MKQRTKSKGYDEPLLRILRTLSLSLTVVALARHDMISI